MITEKEIEQLKAIKIYVNKKVKNAYDASDEEIYKFIAGNINNNNRLKLRLKMVKFLESDYKEEGVSASVDNGE